ncbi:hypothetical protein [Reyranella sp.]|jgi:uncharacterized protein HemX|uniref:hypothetical protein n=1 Tax=Reyranella sp. TaxID=1929291 RepID=UPI002F924076
MITRRLAKAVIAILAGTLAIGVAGSAFAETQWEQNHPRRDQVNDRLENQHRRINHEYREGELTRGQARQLHREDRRVRHEERRLARWNGGHITRGEQHALNRQENGISRQIGR